MKLQSYQEGTTEQAGPTPQFDPIHGSRSAFGTQFGEQIEQAAQTITAPIIKEQEQERERLTTIQLANAESALHSAFLAATDKPESQPGAGDGGLKTKTGELARKAAPDVMKIVGETHTANLTGLTLPHAKALYESRSRGMLASYQDSVNQYVTDQDKVALRASVKTATTVGLSMIASNYKSPDLVARTEAEVETKLKALSNSEDGGASAGAHVNDWYSSVGQMLIRQNLKENTMAGIETAKKLASQYQPFLGEHAAQIEGEIVVATQKVGGVTAAMDAATKNTYPNSSLIDEQKAQSAIMARQDLDPFAKTFARTHLQSLISEGQAAQKNANEGSFSRIYSAYRTRGWAGIPTQDISYLRDQPVHQGTELWQKFLDIVRSDAIHAESRPETEGERRAYGAFLADIAAHPEKFSDMSIENFQADYHGSFNPRRRVEADSLVSGLKRPVGQTEGLSTNELKMVLQYGRQGGMFKNTDPTLWSPEDELRMESITSDVVSKRTSWMAMHPKQKPGPTEVQSWVKEWFEPNKVLGGFFHNETITRAEAVTNPAPYRGKTIIPKRILNQIDEALSQINLSHDDVNRQWMYRQWKAGIQNPTLDQFRTEP